MRIGCISRDIVCEIRFLNAGRRSGDFHVETLPVHKAIVDQLPAGMYAIIATAEATNAFAGYDTDNAGRTQRTLRLAQRDGRIP